MSALLAGATTASANPAVTYEMRDRALIASLDNVEYVLFDVATGTPDHLFSSEIDPSAPLIENGLSWIEATEDLDQDGLLDAVIGISAGGNCCAPAYAIVSLLADGSFRFSPILDWAWTPPQIQLQDDTFVLETHTDNHLYRHRYPNGQVILLEERAIAERVAIAELRATLIEDGATTARLDIDLNADGAIDTVQCEIWERWGALLCQLALADGTALPMFIKGTEAEPIQVDSHSCFRLGVLSSMTNGMHDLICDENTLATWNGSGYVWQFPQF
ncbi:MAG: hypothetical protein ACFB0E_02670 [Leptolyngbyaceae cyanobacterium]